MDNDTGKKVKKTILYIFEFCVFWILLTLGSEFVATFLREIHYFKEHSSLLPLASYALLLVVIFIVYLLYKHIKKNKY